MIDKITVRIKILVLTALLVFAAGNLTAQTGQNTAQGITVENLRMSLAELFAQIEQQTGQVVIFNATDVDGGRMVDLPKYRGTLTEILDGTLPSAGYAWQRNGRYIVVIESPESTTPAQSKTPQPSHADFERAIKEYTRTNIPHAERGRTIVHYDTIRTEKPHNGIFRYPAHRLTPQTTGIPSQTEFDRDTPPLLAIKTNLVWWAVGGTPNLAGEIGLGKHTSLEIAGGNNRWNLRGTVENNKKMVHWSIKPEFRYWFCERFGTGSFMGVHAFYGKYNIGSYDIPMLFEKEFRYEGYAYGAGINYGYNWAWSKRWGMEFTIGAGVMQMNYVKKDCEKCGNEVGRYRKTYLGPTELGVKVVFMIK